MTKQAASSIDHRVPCGWHPFRKLQAGQSGNLWVFVKLKG
jgi:hypothetical protein